MDLNLTEDSAFVEEAPAYVEDTMAYSEEAVLAVREEHQDRVSEDTLYSRVIRWALTVGAILLPLFFLPWTTGVLELNKMVLLMAVAAVCLIAWLLSVVSTGRLAWRVGLFDKAVLAILGASLIGTIFSLSRFTSLFGLPNTSVTSLASILSLSIIYFTISYTVEDRGRGILNSLGISAAIALVYGLFQILGLHILRFSFANSSAFTTVGSPNALGIFAALSLAFLGSNSASGWMRIVHRIGMVAAVVILVILNWWVLWIVASAGMLGLIAFESIRQERFRITRFILPMTLIVLAVFLTVANFNITAVKNKLPTEVGPSFTLSGHITKSVLTDDFITGYGPENFSIAFDRYGASRLVNSTLSGAKFYDAMSALFNFIIEGGLIMILALLVLVWALIQAVRSYIIHRSSRSIPEYAPAVWGTLVASLAAFCLYPTDTTLLFATYVVLALAGLTIATRKQEFNIEDRVTLSLSASLGFIGGLILVLVGVYFGVSLYIADAKYALATQQTDQTKAASLISDAVNWNSHEDTYYRGASQVALALLNTEISKKADPTDTQQSTRIQNYISSAINLAKAATTANPNEELNWTNLGDVYRSLLGLVDGVDQLSQAAYLKAADLRPGDASFYNDIGNLYVAKAQLLSQLATGANATTYKQQATAALALAETNYSKAVDISSNFGLAIYNLGQVYDEEGKLNEAITQLEKIAPFNTDQPNLLFELGLLYYRAGNMDKAFSTLQQVLVLSPDYANAHWYLSLIYEQRKDIPNAIAELQKILSVDANKDNQTVLDRLAQLQKTPPVTNTGKGIDQKPL